MKIRPGGSTGIVAVILAAGVSLSLIVLTAAAAWALVDRHNTVPEHIASLLTTALGALVGALSVYLGRGLTKDEAASQEVEQVEAPRRHEAA